MASFFYYLTIVFIAAVVLVLFRGLFNMMRGGSPNLSNKLMQLRILLQFIAVALIVIVLWLTGGGR
ncbi:MAG: twin transmembrane helix small protein [Rhizobiaceae bacterium]|nr:twin transmembrane helix small protein [Rhizobiaceae bacterium]MDF2373225.1 twin transmembrane helix small protein [Rhizobiaceae bacterium]|tara:strand:- start:47757 stop:47954 length:198 start_codon:yes stop_codon:yes gene_type:complete